MQTGVKRIEEMTRVPSQRDAAMARVGGQAFTNAIGGSCQGAGAEDAIVQVFDGVQIGRRDGACLNFE